MEIPAAFYMYEGGWYVPTDLVRGPWSRDLQHGGPPAALLARTAAAVAQAGEVARLSVDFLRPIPVEPLTVASASVRMGKRVHVVGASLLTREKEVARATALFIRRADIPVAPQSVAAAAFPDPTACEPFDMDFFPDEIRYHRGVEMRRVRGRLGSGAMAVWMRLRVPLVLGTPTSPIERVAVVADSGNGVSLLLDPARYTFVNPDLTVHLHRTPGGEWIGLDAVTTVGPDGAGIADTALQDARGPIGRSIQGLLIDRR